MLMKEPHFRGVYIEGGVGVHVSTLGFVRADHLQDVFHYESDYGATVEGHVVEHNIEAPYYAFQGTKHTAPFYMANLEDSTYHFRAYESGALWPLTAAEAAERISSLFVYLSSRKASLCSSMSAQDSDTKDAYTFEPNADTDPLLLSSTRSSRFLLSFLLDGTGDPDPEARAVPYVAKTPHHARIALKIAQMFGIRAEWTGGDKVWLDAHRPSCFSAKLTLGNFKPDEQGVKSVNGLIGQGTLSHVLPVSYDYIMRQLICGTFSEGRPLEGSVPLKHIMQMKGTKKFTKLRIPYHALLETDAYRI